MNPLLLGDPSPSLRYRVLSELGDAPADDGELATWRAQIPGSLESLRRGVAKPVDFNTAAYDLCRLVYLGYQGPEVATGAEWILGQQQRDGSWPMPGYLGAPASRGKGKPRPAQGDPYKMKTIQTALPLRGVASAGYATDPRAERGYEWLLSERLDDGSWPGSYRALDKDGKPIGETPGYRRLPGTNGCRAATTAALACFALHPDRRTSEPARTALDHLLAVDRREEWSLGFEVSRLVGLERASGSFTFYVVFDLAFILDLASRCGASMRDGRVAGIVDFLESVRGPYGLWEHAAHPQLSRWLTFEIESSLRRLESGDWVGGQRRVPSTAYPKRRQRY